MSIENVGIGMLAPPSWANSSTPTQATIACGYHKQNVVYTVDGTNILQIGFAENVSWSNNYDLSGDLSGANWTTLVPGIYQLNIAQNLTVQNVANITNPVINITVNVASNTTELDQILRTTLMVPVTIGPMNINAVVSGIVCCELNSVITIAINVPSGDIDVTSGYNALPDPSGYFSWNLIAQGIFGAQGVII